MKVKRGLGILEHNGKWPMNESMNNMSLNRNVQRPRCIFRGSHIRASPGKGKDIDAITEGLHCDGVVVNARQEILEST